MISIIVVLIETYWNVKEKKRKVISGGNHVLIETYWNVKIFIFCLIWVAFISINRNILECKVGLMANSGIKATQY